ncbi:hypothetical protein [Litoreibacter janthinus]|uniref:Uncharacterized protein n=1 Tax=Litoreibacter janthinus TaxID=670154 RepID=A0A1I6GQ96_9RHOB|nr:hypothetical protein [Litoreibacter janthinus]SFR44350.1 hypothetical protein SAMN04488002_1832 [Litoreibacter janthinus]
MNYELRALHDIARWERGVYNSDAGWILARIEPAGDSGSATLPGGSISAETGALSVPDDARLSLIKSGRWVRLSGTAQTKSGDFGWYDPLDEDKRALSPEDVYSPFVAGGKLLFVPNWTEQGDRQFDTPVLVLDEWLNTVEGANALSLPAEAAMANPSPEILKQLPDARNSNNPFLSAWAWRHTFMIKQDLPPLGLDAITGWPLALRTRLALDIGGERAVDEVVRASQLLRNVSQLEAMALGAYSALQLPTGGNLASVHATLKAVSQSASAFEPYENSAPKLSAILAMTGFD